MAGICRHHADLCFRYKKWADLRQTVNFLLQTAASIPRFGRTPVCNGGCNGQSGPAGSLVQSQEMGRGFRGKQKRQREKKLVGSAEETDTSPQPGRAGQDSRQTLHNPHPCLLPPECQYAGNDPTRQRDAMFPKCLGTAAPAIRWDRTNQSSFRLTARQTVVCSA